MTDLGQAAGGEQSETEAPTGSGPSGLRALRDGGARALAQVKTRAPGKYWSHLTAVDFINSSFAFSALALICGFPFLAVVNAVVGGDVRQAIITRMGLNDQAARDLNSLIASGHHAVATLTAFSAVLLVLGAMGMASTLQQWYQRIYDQPPVQSAFQRMRYQAAGVVAFPIYIAIEVEVFKAIGRAGGGKIAIFALTFVFAVLFWWWSAYFLLFRKVSLRKLLPAGIATGFCITGLGIFSSLLFSEQITSGERSYGPAGVVLAVTSYLVGFGVCLHLGAVFGRAWNDWRALSAGDGEPPPSASP
jgi:membrane protein